MNIKKFFSENSYGIFFAVCLSILGVSTLLRTAGISSPLAVCLFSLGFTSLFAAVYFNRRRVLTYICIALAVAAPLIILSAAGISAADYLSDTLTALLSGEELSRGQIYAFCALVSFVFSVVCYILAGIKYVRFASVAVCTALFIYYGFHNTVMDFAEDFSAMSMIICGIAEICLLIKYRAEKNVNTKGVMSCLIPVMTVFSVAVTLLPSSGKAISWQFVIDFAEDVKTFVQDATADIEFAFSPELSEFNIAMQGYSQNGGFAGRLIPDGRQELSVSFSPAPRTSLYLIGTANDIYSGDGWKKSNYSDFSNDDYYLDYCELIYALTNAGYSEDDIEQFVRREAAVVSYNNIKTKTMFYPLKMYAVYDYDSSIYYAQAPSVVFKKTAKSDTKYKVSYLEVDYRSSDYAEIARNAKGYQGNVVLPSEFFDKPISDDIGEILKQRSDYIEKTYSVLPDSVTQRTYELADEITAGCTTDYDKLVAIEKYVSENYEYTLEPGDVPEGYDTVDYFLFESKKGYCTHFASAMAVLARCEGIPSRYVHGFMLDISSVDSYTESPVLRSDAHTWTECYIEGVGWIPFEPTASFDSVRYTYTPKVAVPLNTDTSHGYGEETHGTYEFEEKEQEEKTDVRLYIIAAIISVLCIALAVVGYIAFRALSFSRKYKKSSDTQKFIMCYKLIVYVCMKKGLVRSDGETADMFASRAGQRYDSSDGAPLCEITSVFDRIRYGQGSAGEEERSTIEKYQRRIFDVIKNRDSKAEAFMLYIGFSLKQ